MPHSKQEQKEPTQGIPAWHVYFMKAIACLKKLREWEICSAHLFSDSKISAQAFV